MTTAYITHPDCLKHEMGSIHPESPARLRAIEDQLIAGGLMNLLRAYDAPEVTEEQLLRVHSEAYLRELERSAPSSGLTWLDPDTAMNPHTLAAARRAAGAGVLAVELLVRGEADTAFCAVRPPGHHAERARAMGFCFFNNVAIAVAHALEAHGIERIAILDFDVHHGNGTEIIFGNDPRVLLCSAFQHPFYPFADLEHAPANVINAPLRAGAYSEEFQQAITERWLPPLEAFAPQMIFISAGFDGHFEDDLGQLNLLDTDFAWVTQRAMEAAGRHADGRVISMLEGGYALDALARSVAVHLRCMMGING